MIFPDYLQDLHSCIAFHSHQCPVLGLQEYCRFLFAPGHCGYECRSTEPMARHGCARVEHRCTYHIARAMREGPGLCLNGPTGRACGWKTQVGKAKAIKDSVQSGHWQLDQTCPVNVSFNIPLCVRSWNSENLCPKLLVFLCDCPVNLL